MRWAVHRSLQTAAFGCTMNWRKNALRCTIIQGDDRADASGPAQLRIAHQAVRVNLRKRVSGRLLCSGWAGTIGAVNPYAMDWLANRLKPTIARTLGRLLDGHVELSFEVLGTEGA